MRGEGLIMISTIIEEYKDNIQNRKFALFYALICYYRMPHFRVMVLSRLMQETSNIRKRKQIAKKLCIKYGVEIGINSKIGKYLNIKHINGIVIGDGTTLGSNITIYQNITIGQRNGKYPCIRDNVTIYPGAVVLGDVTVHNNAIILANTVVLHDVPENTIVAGIPGVVIKQR